jgi:hypothetical protein
MNMRALTIIMRTRFLDKSFNNEGFIMVPLAWTTHVQSRPQLLHYLSSSFTFTKFLFPKNKLLKTSKQKCTREIEA